MKLKHLTIPFEIKEIDDTSDSDYYKFEGYGSTFDNVDLGGDKVLPGAYTRTIEALKNAGKQLPVLWQHDTKMPLGVYTDLSEDGKGLFVNGKMPKADAFVRDRVFPQMKIGSVMALSIGYRIPKGGAEYVNGVRELKEIELAEVSLVTMPMNPQATISSVKGASPYHDLPIAADSTVWDAKEAAKRVNAFTNDNDKMFLWSDSENAENKVFPFADVIDGTLKAIPKALFMAAAMLHSAKIIFSEDDKEVIKNNIDKYYKKMGRESPLQDENLVISITDFNLLTVRDIESILSLENTKFSKKASKKLISYFNVKNLREEDNDVQRDAAKDNELVNSKLTEILNLIERHPYGRKTESNHQRCGNP